MSTQLSFTKIENELLPEYRRKIGSAESTEDVKKFFIYTIQELVSRLADKKMTLNYEDISLAPDQTPAFVIREALYASSDFSSVWHGSDLPNVIGRFAETAVKHFRHLKKNPQKTEAKIRM